MVPAKAVDAVLSDLFLRLAKHDVVIDGGNSFFGDDMRRAAQLEKQGIRYRAAGTHGEQRHGDLHCGPVGAGHFVKMVHNGIEYGLMAAYAEGFNVLRHARYPLNLADVAEVWRRGSVVSSWLLDLTARALAREPDLAEFSGSVSDSGEGRWTLQTAIAAGVLVPVLSAALCERFTSRGEADFAAKLLSALRFEFGGHEEKA